MAHLWIRSDDIWEAKALGPDGSCLPHDRGSVLPRSRGLTDWVVVCRPGSVRANGEAIATGIRVLRDRDELMPTAGERIFFSTETLPQVEPFLGNGQAMICPRCLNPIEEGQPSVRCGCGLVYHEDPEESRLCFTYAPCLSCFRENQLDAGYRWTPEELG